MGSGAGPDVDRHRVVVIGSGFGGLSAAKALRRADVSVTVIAKTNHHLFQPLLYQVATGILAPGEIARSTRDILSEQGNAQVLLGEVVDIDVESRTVTSDVLGRRLVTGYDSLIVAAGATQSYFGNDQFADFAPGMKSIDDALELRGRIYGAFELAEVVALRGEEVGGLLTFAIIGAGPTGVELAGQIAELAHRTLRRDFRSIDPREARVVLVDAAPQVLSAFGPQLGATAAQQLGRLGVEVVLGAVVTHVDERAVEMRLGDGSIQRLESVTKIWAAGVESSRLSRVLAVQTGAQLDRAGRIMVNPDLTLPGHPDVWAVGDMVAVDGLPGVAQVAIQGGRFAAKEVIRRLNSVGGAGPFEYVDKGSMAIISRFRAIVAIGRFKLTGPAAWLMWLVLHLAYVNGFKNRLTALLHWSVSFVGRSKPERIVTEQQVFGRRALARLELGASDLVSTSGRYSGTRGQTTRSSDGQ
ncbi:NAD(P)/FAD-dependent oxidoreductase [Nocardioides sp. AN3]